MRILALLVLLPASAFAEDLPFPKLVELFEYDPSTAAEIETGPVETVDGVVIEKYSFAGPDGGRVPGLLIRSSESTPGPVILYGHWMKPGSPYRNHQEFRDEAIVMAQAGAVCLLLDGPLVRGEVPEITDPMEGQGTRPKLQMAREWRRAIDLLVERDDIDPNRIAYVGHSFNAGVGAMLTAVERRIHSFALMAANYTQRETITRLSGRDAATIASYFNNFPWADTVQFSERSAPSAVFLQFGRRDELVPSDVARKGAAHFRQPNRMAFYNAGHELDVEARVDRGRWLAGRLNLSRLDEAALRAIPELQ